MKILPDGDLKPQGKQLETRVLYLLKLMQKSTAATQKAVKPAKKKKAKVKGEKSAEAGNGKEKKEGNNDADGKKKKKKRKKDKKDKKVKKGPGPALHFTHGNKPQIVDNDLDPHIFSQCKEKLRPVKKVLKQLSENPAAKETDCLLKIGARILECLNDYKNEPEVAKEWRNHLWTFVSKFTEYSPKRVYKMYKHAMKNAPNGISKPVVNNNNAHSNRPYHPLPASSHHRPHHHHPSQHPPPPLHSRPPKRESDSGLPLTSPPKRSRPESYPHHPPGYAPNDGYMKYDRYGHPIRKLPLQHSAHGGHGDGPPRLNPHLQPHHPPHHPPPHAMRPYPQPGHVNHPPGPPLIPHPPPQLHAGSIPPVAGTSRAPPNWNMNRGFPVSSPVHANANANNSVTSNYSANNNSVGR